MRPADDDDMHPQWTIFVVVFTSVVGFVTLLGAFGYGVWWAIKHLVMREP